MGQKYRNLMGQIVDPENLRLAYKRARNGKRMSTGHLRFKEHVEANLEQIQQQLVEDAYRVSDYTTFHIYEPKKREIMALPFYDRVVQHALINVVGPIFEKVFMPVSYACREGMGAHKAIVHVQRAMKRLGKSGQVYCLKMDFSKYFASIDLAVLNAEIRRKISCQATLGLIETITLPTGKGLPIGNLTSQVWANLYGHIWDRWLVHEKRVEYMFRYMDDTLVLSNDREMLFKLRLEAAEFIAEVLKLKFSQCPLLPVQNGIPFLGYRIFPKYRLLKKDSVKRAKRKIVNFRKYGEYNKLRQFVASWGGGHASWANTHNLLTKLGVA